MTRTWDAVGNKATEAYPSGLNLTYAWTDVNQLASISDGTSTIGSWTYGGQRTRQVDYQNGAKTLFTYSGFRGEVGTVHHRDSSNATILQLDYGYDTNHDRTYERYGASGSAGDAFAYDKARRLTNAWVGSVTPTTPTTVAYTTKIDYNMDDDGNRTSVVTTPYGQSGSTSSYTTNTLNQYTAVGGTSRSHDGNGNVSDDGTYTYAFNYKNLIVKATRKSDSVVVSEYRYDALGRRVEKVVTGATYRYLYSGVETVSVYTSTGTWKQDFVYDAGIDGIVMLSQADVLDQDSDTNTSETTRSFYHRNALGSVMAITDLSQSVAVSYRYDPYGNVTITRNSTVQSSDPLGQFVTYTGRWCDEETGLQYYRARGYDPRRGSFLQRDPGGVLVGANLFTYCSSRPTGFIDPFGFESFAPSGKFKVDVTHNHYTVPAKVTCEDHRRRRNVFCGPSKCVQLDLILDWDVETDQMMQWHGRVDGWVAQKPATTETAEGLQVGGAVATALGLLSGAVAALLPVTAFVTGPLAGKLITLGSVSATVGTLMDKETPVVPVISATVGEWRAEGSPATFYSNWTMWIAGRTEVKCPAKTCDCALLTDGLVEWAFQDNGSGDHPPGMPGPPAK